MFSQRCSFIVTPNDHHLWGPWSVFCHRRFDEVRALKPFLEESERKTSPWHNQLFFCHDSWAEDQVLHSLGAQARGLTSLFCFILRKLYCARDVSSLLGAFIIFLFQRGFGSQLSRQGAPEISQGSLKAGGQRPLPRSEQRGGLISSSYRLILLKQTTKTKIPLCKSTHVQTRHPTQQWFTSPSRLAKMYGARDI